MKVRHLKRFLSIATVLLMLIATVTGCSQKSDDFPSSNITMIIPYSAGGNADTVGRLAAQYLSDELGVQVVCVNKPGSSGELGAMEIAESKADGYTIGLVNSPDFLISDIVNPEFDFDFYESVDYLASFTKTPFSYYAPEGSDIDTWDKFVDYCKANPGKVTVGEGGIAHRVLAAAIMDYFDIKFTTVNFAGASDVVAALLGGHVSAASSGNQQYSNIAAGGCVPIAWGGDTPCADRPDTPMFKDYGLSIDFLSVCNTIVIPKNVPDDVKQKLLDACIKVAERPEMKEQIEATGYTYSPMSGEELTTTYTEYFETAKEICEKYSDLILAK